MKYQGNRSENNFLLNLWNTSENLVKSIDLTVNLSKVRQGKVKTLTKNIFLTFQEMWEFSSVREGGTDVLYRFLQGHYDVRWSSSTKRTFRCKYKVYFFILIEETRNSVKYPWFSWLLKNMNITLTKKLFLLTLNVFLRRNEFCFLVEIVYSRRDA